jgi:hypothetical protein
MCIIFYNENGKPYDRDMLSVAYDNNPHGMGVMWVEEGKVQTLKGLFSKHRMFDILKHFEGVPHAMHLRWRTRGKIEKNFCHPFRASHAEADQQVYMMHNGTFLDIETKQDESDTIVFAERMQKITRDHGTSVLFTESFLRRVEKDIKSWNKVIFLRGDGKVSIMNPSEWDVVNGLWMSNTYSLKEGYRKSSLVASVASKITTRISSPPATGGLGEGAPAATAAPASWIAKSEEWEKAQRRAAEARKVKASEKAEDPTLSKRGRKLARRERRRLERELMARKNLESIRSNSAGPTGQMEIFKGRGPVVRRRRLEDGTIETTAIDRSSSLR